VMTLVSFPMYINVDYFSLFFFYSPCSFLWLCGNIHHCMEWSGCCLFHFLFLLWIVPYSAHMVGLFPDVVESGMSCQCQWQLFAD